MARLPLRLHRAAVALASAVAASLLVVAAPAGAATRIACAKHPHELARSYGGTLWVEHGELYGCAPAVRSTVRGRSAPARPRVHLGSWTDGATAALSRTDAAWTVRATPPGASASDQVWATDLRGGQPWLRGTAPIGAEQAAPNDERIAALRVYRDTVSWVTAGGAIVVRPRRTNTDLDGLIGGDLIGTKSSAAGGLVPTLTEVRHRVLIGRWPEPASIDAAAATLKMGTDEWVASDDGGCSAIAVLGVTARPVSGARRVGGTWAVDIFDGPADCDRPTVSGEF